MNRARTYAGDMRWGWNCPRCNTEVTVSRDRDSETFEWRCPSETCLAVGFGFTSRRRARLGLLEYHERYQETYR